MIKTTFCLLLSFMSSALMAQRSHSTAMPDSLCSYKVILDDHHKLLACYRPSIEGAAYSYVISKAASFMKESVPVDPKTGLKLYFISCCFQGPHMTGQTKFAQGTTWEDWMNNPACMFAGMTKSLALDYYAYSGDVAYVQIARGMLDYQISHGTTPADWEWKKVPYASSDPGATEYNGASRWVAEGYRGDGPDGIEPDKIAELGSAYLAFFKLTTEEKYLRAALDCADALAKHVTRPPLDRSPFAKPLVTVSPWPFRVNAKTGAAIDPYCSNVIEPIRLMDDLIRIHATLRLSEQQLSSYRRASAIAWEWLLSKQGPLHSFVWNGYFEDIAIDTLLANRIQTTPLETARYFLKQYPRTDSLMRYVPAILHWVKSSFSEGEGPGIKEQTWCYVPMGSHTARYGSVCALYHAVTGDASAREEAYRNLNYATYMTDPNGVVRVGPTWPATWFSDGYGDYIKHFMEAMAAVPEWAPAEENHLLSSTSVVQHIVYTQKDIVYTTFDTGCAETLRLTKKPSKILDGKSELRAAKGGEPGWQWKPLAQGGVLTIRHNGPSIQIIL